MSEGRASSRIVVGLLIRGLVLPILLALIWRIEGWIHPRGWPLGLDALFRTDLPPVLAVLMLARLASARVTASEAWAKAEWAACAAFLPAAVLPFLPGPIEQKADAASILFASLVALWAALSFWRSRPVLGAEERARLSGSLALFFCFFGVYLAVGRYICHIAAPTGDEPHYLMVSHSLWQDWDLDLRDDFDGQEYRQFYPAPFGPRPWDIRTSDGRIYSWGGALFPAVLAIPYGLGGRSGAVVMLNLLAAVAMVLVHRLGRVLGGDPRRSFLVCAVLGVSLPVLAYSSVLYPEMLAALLLLIALNLAAGTTPSSGRWLVALGILLVLCLLRAKYLALALPAAMVLVGARGRKSAFAAGGAFVLALGAYLALDFAYLNGEYAGRLGGYLSTLIRDVLQEHHFGRLAGVWLDQEGGILLYNPLIVAGILALPHLARAGPVGLAAALSAVVYAIAAGAAYEAWYGEWWYPGRFLVGSVVVLGVAWSLVPAGPEAQVRRAWTRPLLLFGALQAAVFAFSLILWPRLAYNYADGTSSALGAVELAIARPVCRYVPSFIRPAEPSQVAVPALILLGVAVLWIRGIGNRWRARVPAWPVDLALGLALFAGVWSVPFWGHRWWATAIIEAEDPLVRENGAKPWPPGRPYHQRAQAGDLRMGLRLPPDARMSHLIRGYGRNVVLQILASAESGAGRLAVILDRKVLTTLDVAAGAWGPYGAYGHRRLGPSVFTLRNVGTTDILVDRVDIDYP